MPKVKKRYDFTKKDSTGAIKKVGYLDLEEEKKEEEEKRCSLYFYGDIVSSTWESMWFPDDKCPQDIADFLESLDGCKEIDIYFNSGGGDVFAGLAIYNQLKRFSGKKTGYVDGMAASIASVIMFACDELHFATGAQAMIHRPMCFACGNVDDFEDAIKQLNMCEDSILDVYEQNLNDGVTRDDIREMMAKETWFNGEELAKYFKVELESRAPVAACTSDYFEKYIHVPEDLAKNKDKIVSSVIAELEKRNEAKKEEEAKRIEKEKQEILEDLYLYGI